MSTSLQLYILALLPFVYKRSVSSTNDKKVHVTFKSQGSWKRSGPNGPLVVKAILVTHVFVILGLQAAVSDGNLLGLQ